MNEAKEKILDIIEKAIYEEIRARDFYTAILRQMDDPGAKLKLDVMAATENKHKEFLMKWYRDISGRPFTPSAPPDKGFLQIRQPPRDARFKDIVEIIVEAETRACEFYTQASQQVSNPEQKRIFNFLAQMEKEHQEHFKGEFYTLLEDRSIKFADEEIPWMIESME